MATDEATLRHAARAGAVLALSTGGISPASLARDLPSLAAPVDEVLTTLSLLGIIGPANGTIARPVLISRDQWYLAEQAIQTGQPIDHPAAGRGIPLEKWDAAARVVMSELNEYPAAEAKQNADDILHALANLGWRPTR